MAYVITETQSKFTRSEKDFGAFERSYFKKVELDYRDAPKVFEKMKDENGRKFTAVFHAETNRLINAIQ